MTVCSKEAKRILLLKQIKGIGAAKLNTIMNTPGFCSMTVEQNLMLIFKKSEDIETHCAPSALSKYESLVNQQLDLAEEHGVDILCGADELFPKLLRKSKHNCAILYSKGNMQDTRRAAAVIGTRKLPPKWDQVAKRITETLVDKNFSIISGLALGTDSVAHKAAVDRHGRTVAVLAHGLDTVEPKSNRKLAEQILDEGGALVSQFPMDTPLASYNFAERDSIQAGLSEFVVMIASGINGGSLIASKAVLEDGRYLFVPKPFGDSADAEKLEANKIVAGGDRDLISQLFVKKPKDSNKSIAAACSDPLSRIFVLAGKHDYEKFDSVGILDSDCINDACHRSLPKTYSGEQYNLFD